MVWPPNTLEKLSFTAYVLFTCVRFVIGVPNVTLSPPQNGTQGPVMSSEKNNVKLESGTMLLLKVNQ